MTTDLIKRLEEAAEGSRELDEAIADAVCERESRQCGEEEQPDGRWAPYMILGYKHSDRWYSHPPDFTTSLDAAMTLVPEGWITHIDIYPGDCCEVHITANDGRFLIKADTEAYGRGKTAPLAIVDAALKAKDQS